MKKITISMMMFFAAVACVNAQQHSTVELFINTSTGSTFNNRVGWYNNYADKMTAGSIFWDAMAVAVTGNGSSFEENFYERVTEMRVTGKNNYGIGIRLRPSFAKRIAVGATFNRFTYYVDKKWESGDVTNERETFGLLMGDINGTWLQEKNWSLYSGLGLGFSRHTFQKPKSIETKSRFGIKAQVNLVGVRYQDGKFGAFVEIGHGPQGALKGGLVVTL